MMELTPVSLHDEEPRTPERGGSAASPAPVWGGGWQRTPDLTPGRDGPQRFYYYNAETRATSWQPPPGWTEPAQEAASASRPQPPQPVAQVAQPEPARQPAPAWSLQLLHLSAFALWGTLLRCALVSLFGCYSRGGSSGDSCRSLSDGVLFTAVVPNVVGCFLMGIFASAFVCGDAPSQLSCLPSIIRAQRLVRLHLGMRTGFCGSLTTWASWSNAMMLRASGGDVVRAALGYLFGALTAGAAFGCGQQTAVALCDRHRERGEGEEGEDEDEVFRLPVLADLTAEGAHESTHFLAEDGVAVGLLLMGLGLSMGFASAQGAGPSLRTAGQAALLSPLGVAARWQLVAKFNAPPVVEEEEEDSAAEHSEFTERRWFPFGTLASNSLACLFDAALSAWTSRAPGAQRAHVSDVLMSGFAGALSTVSTVAAETATFFAQPASGGARRGYAYLAATWALGFAPSIALFLITRAATKR